MVREAAEFTVHKYRHGLIIICPDNTREVVFQRPTVHQYDREFLADRLKRHLRFYFGVLSNRDMHTEYEMTRPEVTVAAYIYEQCGDSLMERDSAFFDGADVMADLAIGVTEFQRIISALYGMGFLSDYNFEDGDDE